MSTLQLITTETFGSIQCDFYRNLNDEILLTREQIGIALEYCSPENAIRKLHHKHKDRLESLCLRIKNNIFDCTSIGYGRKSNLQTERVYYTERGVMEICRWSRQPKANQFMDWVWDIVENYRAKNNKQILLDQYSTLLSSITEQITELQKDLQDVKEAVMSKNTVPKRYSRWKTKTFDTLKAITDRVNEIKKENFQLKDIIHETIIKLEDTCEISLNDYQEMYMCEKGLSSIPYVIDTIGYYPKLKSAYDQILNDLAEKLDLKEENEKEKRSNALL